MDQRLNEIYTALEKEFGKQHWWPGDSRLEIILGAILTQNTNWKNAEKAINRLKEKDLLSLNQLDNLALDELAFYIKPSGYYNQKAKKIRNFLSFLKDEYDNDLDSLSSVPTYDLREELLEIWGIGQETADSILLYALQKPVFVVDTYTFRVLIRHNLISENYSYEEVQELFINNLEEDIDLYGEFHALFVELGKKYCKKSKVLCEECPLQSDLAIEGMERADL